GQALQVGPGEAQLPVGRHFRVAGVGTGAVTLAVFRAVAVADAVEDSLHDLMDRLSGRGLVAGDAPDPLEVDQRGNTFAAGKIDAVTAAAVGRSGSGGQFFRQCQQLRVVLD